MSSSPFSMKCETHLYYMCLTSEAKQDTYYRCASLIGCLCPKILGHVLSLPTLSKIFKNFHLPPSLCLGHHRLLSSSTPPSSTRALECATVLDPSLEHAATILDTDPEHAAVDRKHTVAVLDPDPRAHHNLHLQRGACHRRPQAHRHHRAQARHRRRQPQAHH
jgi:hypothetical protein